VQKDLGWMAGTKTGKVGGLNVKNRTGMQLLLNCSGPRVDSRKDEGSLTKMLGRRGMFRSDPLNLDPAAQICWARDLIVTAGHRSDGSGRLGARAAALATGGEHLRWWAAALAPDFTELDAPGLKSTRAWVRRVRRNTRNPPRVTAGLAEALGGECKGGGGSARHDSPACAFVRCSGLEDGGKRLWSRA